MLNIIPYVERLALIPANVQAVCIEIQKPNAKPIIISTCYRPPIINSEIIDSFETYLQNIAKENKKIIITGDFNIGLFPNHTQHNRAKRFNELFNSYQLSQQISKPTRTTESTKTLLDLIMRKTDDTKIVSTDVVHPGISYHSLVYIGFKTNILTDPNMALQEWNKIFLIMAEQTYH